MNARARPGGRHATVVHLSPHPDDELIGSPATLMALRDAGWRVVNVVCGLGHEQGERREHEAREASRLTRFELRIVPVARGEEQLIEMVTGAIAAERPALVVAPSPQDAHPRHEAVGRAAVAACERSEQADGPPRLWLWGVWADLPLPTLAVAFGETRLREVLGCLDAYAGELRRNDYRRLVRGRAEMNASLGAERVFGFGSRSAPPLSATRAEPADVPGPESAQSETAVPPAARAQREGVEPAGAQAYYVELLSEVALVSGSWRLGGSRWFDPTDPFGLAGAELEVADDSAVPVDAWLHEPSPGSVYRGRRDLR